MSDTVERPSFRVVMYGSSLEPEAEVKLDQFLANFDGSVFAPCKTADGAPAFVSDEASAQSVLATVMNDINDLPSDVGIGAIRATEDTPDAINTDDVVPAKAPGSQQVNGTFTTIMEVLRDTLTGQGSNTSESVDTLDDVKWAFDKEDTEGDVVDSAVTDSPDSDDEAETAEPEGDEGVATGTPDDHAQNAEPDTDTDSPEDESDYTTDEDARQAIVSQLVDSLVPSHVTDDVSAPLSPSADYPADMSAMIDALVTQANTMLRFSCREADADVGLLSDAEVTDEKTRLVESLLIQSPPPITDYVAAINYLDQVIADVEAQVDDVRAEFQRREDDWVEEKLAQVIPQLREMFRSTYPTTKEKVSQEVLDAAQPEISGAEKQVDETEARARHNVALALRHQSETGRNLSSLLGLHELRADMQSDLDESVARLIDSHAQQERVREEQQQARIAEIEATAQAKADAYAQEQIAAARAEQQQADAVVDSDADTTADDAVDLIDSEHAENASDDVVDSDADAIVDSEWEDTPEQDTTDSDADAEPELDTATDIDADPVTETDTETGASPMSSNESDDDDEVDEEADNHPSIGDVSRAGGDSWTSFSDDPTGAFASPVAHNTDPETGEDLEFREEDYEQPRRGRVRNALRRFFGRS